MVVTSTIGAYFLAISLWWPFDFPFDPFSSVIEAFRALVGDVSYYMAIVTLSCLLTPRSVATMFIIIVLSV